MKIKTIFMYSHEGKLRQLNFHDGLNIITGKSSTGKSELSRIIEFCMGRTENIISDGVLSEKASWVGVIYKFAGMEAMVAKPVPGPGAKFMQKAMLLKGSLVEIPQFDDLSPNTDDSTVLQILSQLIGIPEIKTDVPLNNSRASYRVSIKHTYHYLFQKQNVVSNQDALFYHQDDFHAQEIKDTLPILLGITSDNKYQIEAQLREERRNLKICEKQLAESNLYSNIISSDGLTLIQEANNMGLVSVNLTEIPTSKVVKGILKKAQQWKPVDLPDTDNGRLWEVREHIEELRNERKLLNKKLSEAKNISKGSTGFSNEISEQKSRLESINLLPRNDSGKWNWPFCEQNLGMDTPLAEALLKELEDLNAELEIVTGEQPFLLEYLNKIETDIQKISDEIRIEETKLAALIASNESIDLLKSRNYAAAKTLGKINHYLDCYVEENDLSDFEEKCTLHKSRVAALEGQLGFDDYEERQEVVLNSISSKITDFMKKFQTDYSNKQFSFSLKNLEVSFWNNGYNTSLKKIGGAENYLAIHLSTLLAIHSFATQNHRPIPEFLLIDQPSQVYFPSEVPYKKMSGSTEETEKTFRISDMEKARNMFKILYDFTQQEVPGFQLIITEHANLKDEWFKRALIEFPWTKPPALIPDDWPTRNEYITEQE